MQFRIADTFTDSLAKLNNEEQEIIKTTAFDLQLNPANLGMTLYKLDKPKSGRIAVEVINHLGDEVMKVFRI
jgi:hypothetical protein